jgi:hypothetical protein
MTEVEKLSLLRAMVGTPNTDENWSDDVLISYLTIAGRKIINRAYPYDDTVDEVPRRYGYLQCEIAAYLLNKRGAEGQTAHSENGISRSYESADIPPSMLSEVIPCVGVL